MRQDALFQLGMDLETPSTAQTEEYTVHGSYVDDTDRKDHFIIKHGVRCAGAHLIIDLFDASRLDDMALMEETMRRCVTEAGATLLHIHLHHFQPNGGISGVAVLAESHISVHTWPENGYAAFDVFMCGEAKPELCVDILRQAFSAKRTAVSEHLRGQGAA
jgi:S-adenosylmethionine decarboxylase